MNRNVKKVSQLPACTSPQATDLLYVSGNNSSNSYRLPINILFGNTDANVVITSYIPETSTDTGKAGTISYDQNYLYICVSDNVWRRIPTETF